MSKNIWLVLLTVVVISLAGCVPADTPPLETVEEETSTAAVMPEAPPEYEITLTERSDDPGQIDVSVVNLLDDQEVFFITLENVDIDHYHGAEFVNNNLYIIKTNGSDEEGWTNELWKFSVEEDGLLLYAAERVDFRVAPDESYIVTIEYGPADFGDDQLIFLDKEGSPVQSLLPGNIEESHDGPSWMLDLGEWSSDGSFFWGTYQLAYKPIFFYQVNVETWELTVFDISDLPLQAEYALNPNTGQLLYSDLPPFIDMSSYVFFTIKQTPVNLYLYDFNQGNQQPVAVVVAQSFRPEWINDEVFAYRDPVGRGRIHYNLAEGISTLVPSEKVEEIEVYPRIIPVEFETIMDSLMETGPEIMLPPELPVEEGYPPVAPRLSITSGRGRYWVVLDLGEDCQGSLACNYGSLAARKIGAGGGAEVSLMPFWSENQNTYIRLAHDITGYYVDPAWCKNCRDGELYWIFNKTEYKASLKNATQEELTSFVNEIIENSLPEIGE